MQVQNGGKRKAVKEEVQSMFARHPKMLLEAENEAIAQEVCSMQDIPEYTEYTPPTWRSDPYHSLPETHEAKDRSGEERLNFFLDRRWTFGPGPTGTGVAEGSTHAALWLSYPAGEQDPAWESLPGHRRCLSSCGFRKWFWWTRLNRLQLYKCITDMEQDKQSTTAISCFPEE